MLYSKARTIKMFAGIAQKSKLVYARLLALPNLISLKPLLKMIELM